ncbi:DUF7226 domain-containing protein [Curtobacterium citreum]
MTTTATRIKDVQGAGTKDATGRTISGGQFYHSRDGGQSAPAVTLQSFTSQSTVNDSFPFPQANDLEKIVTVVDAVAANADTSAAIADTIGVTAEREGTYYADAAGYLGLVETNTTGGLRTYELTELGEHLQLADTAERADLIRQLVTRVPAVDEYAFRGEDGLAEFMEEETDLTGSTLERRAATITSWYKAAKSGEELTGKIGDQRAGADARVLAAAARATVARQEAAERAQPKPAAVCMEHFVELPVSGICDMCV